MSTTIQALSILSLLIGIPAIADGADKQNISLPVAVVSIAIVLGAVLLILWLATPREITKEIDGVTYKREDCYLRDGFTTKEIDASYRAGVPQRYIEGHKFIAEDAFIRYIFIKGGNVNEVDN